MALEIAVLAEIDFSEPTSSKQTQEPVTAELLSDAIEHIYPLLPLAAFWILLGPGDGFNRLLYILFRPLVSLIALKDSAPSYLIVLLLEVRMPVLATWSIRSKNLAVYINLMFLFSPFPR